MVDHGARDHAQWSASATARNWQCPGALALSATAPADKESIHSARGTACHQLAERCLRADADPVAFLGHVETTKEHVIDIDEELVSSAQVYVDYVRGGRLHASEGGSTASLEIEQRFSLAALNPPFDAGGTADAVIYFPAGKALEVVDLKNGMGVVDVHENKQLRTYALGAMLANPGLDVDRITVTIVQPRAHHKDGRIRSETFHVIDLLEWTSDLLAAMRRSKEAFVAYQGCSGNAVLLEQWGEMWLRPGACKFCPAEGFCPALRKRALDTAGLWFDDFDKPRLPNTPEDQSPEVVAKDLDALDMLEDWIKARRGYAHALAESGVPIPNWQLSETFGHRKWAGPEEKVAGDLATIAKLGDDDIYVRKLKSPAQIEKALGAKRKNLIDNMWIKPVTGKALVRVDKASQPAAKSKAESYFQPEN